ncbi:MAG: glutamate 5-kinase, partial [Bacteroidales bacterium]
MAKSCKSNNIDSEISRIVIKVGSNVVTKSDGTLNSRRISRLVEDISILYRWGIEAILITSGAVAAGQSEIPPSKRNNIISSRQAWTA